MEEEQAIVRQIILGDYNATSVHGDASVTVHLPAVSSVLPERVWMVPYRRNSFFTGRETLLAALHEQFLTNRTAVLTQGQAVNGLGGVGKTEIAVEYAYRHGEDYRFVLWASAATTETLRAAYVTIADRLQLPERVLQIVVAALHWLSTQKDWLLIVDNVDDVEGVWSLLPTGNTGHVFLTTRDQMVRNMECLRVEQMDREEGVLLLLRRTGMLKAEMGIEHVSQADRQIAEQIVMEMGGLPLALDQAGAYIEETQCRLADYLSRYQQQRSKLLGRRGRSGRDPSPVASTWSLSFEHVEQQSAVAADLLRVCAFLAPDAIPETIMTKGASHLGEYLQGMREDQWQLDESIGVLRAYSLVHRNRDERLIFVHRLVQAVLKDQMAQEEQCQWAERVVRATNAALPEMEHRTWSQWEVMLPHALVLVSLIKQYEMTMPEAARLLNQAAFYLHDRARYAEAEPLYVCAHVAEKTLLQG